MPIAHTTLLVSDVAASKAFYAAALAPLGYEVAMEFPPHTVGFGTPNGKVDFWLQSTQGVKVPNIHLAFLGESEDKVKGFHAAALYVYFLYILSVRGTKWLI